MSFSSTLFGSYYAPGGTGFPERHPTSRGRATAPRPPQTAALHLIGKTTGAAVQLGERGASIGALPSSRDGTIGAFPSP